MTAIAVEAALDRKTIIWGAPTFDQCRVGWTETRRAASGVASFNESRMTATFPRGGQIVYRSLDNPDNARGHTADGVVIDEAASVVPEAWYEVLRPMLIDTNGWAWLIGTPLGRNWFHREHTGARERENAIAWQAPTLGCRITVDGRLERAPHPLENPHIPFAELQEMWRNPGTSERSFRQEILAEFLEAAGGVFRRVREAASVTAQTERQQGHEYVMGVDWGMVSDATALTVIDATSRQVAAVDRFTGVDGDVQLGRLRAVYERFRPRIIVAEINSIGLPLVQRLHHDGLPVQAFTTTAASKKQAIDALALVIERGELQLLDDSTAIGQTVIDELEAYEAVKLPSGMYRYTAPSGGHDDTVIATALAHHAMNTGGVEHFDLPPHLR